MPITIDKLLKRALLHTHKVASILGILPQAKGGWGEDSTSRWNPSTATLNAKVVDIKTDTSVPFIIRNSDNTIGMELRAGGASLANCFIGYNAGASNTSAVNNLYMGYGAGSSLDTVNNVCIGTYAGGSGGSDNVLIGYRAGADLSTGSENVMIGISTGEMLDANGNIFIGYAAGGYNGTESNSISLGAYSAVTASNQLVIGSYQNSSYKIDDVYIGNGVTKATPTSFTLNATGGSGTNNAGGSMTLAGGKGTGNSLGGSIFFSTSDALGSGVTLQSLTVKMTLLPSGRFGIGVTPTAMLHLKAGTATANTAPLKLNSGTVLTAAEAGAVEFTTDTLFFTITTGAARKGVILDDGARLTSGKIPIATTNGRLIDGQTPLSGTKVYYVSDTSGGAVTRKLTFTNGILTSET